jgi:glycosyltransferase involved in cell wall biosynthesis
MRILLIGPIERTGGVSTHTRYVADKLKDIGVQVEIYNTSPHRGYPKLLEYLVKIYKKSLGISIHLMRSRKNKIDIVHVQASRGIFGFLPILSTVVAKEIFRLKFKTILTFHGATVGSLVGNMLPWVLKRTDILILISEKQKETILKCLKISQNETTKIKLAGNGFDNAMFYPMDKVEARKKNCLPIDKKIIINVSNLYPVKGHKYLIEAMEEVMGNRKDILCVIVGDGPLRKDLQNQIKRLNLEDYVKLVGAKPHDEIPLWMNAADLFVLPSLSEGNPTVMFEALGIGLPFVGTAVGGVPEIIISEDYGLLCEPANPDDLAEKILIALEKEWYREKIRKYAEQFTWNNIAKKVVEVYEEVLKKG